MSNNKPLVIMPCMDYEIQISEGAIDPVADTLVIKAGTGIQWRITAAETLDSTKEMKLDAQ